MWLLTAPARCELVHVSTTEPDGSVSCSDKLSHCSCTWMGQQCQAATEISKRLLSTFVLISWHQSADHTASSPGLESWLNCPVLSISLSGKHLFKDLRGHQASPQAFRAAHVKTNYTCFHLHLCRCSPGPRAHTHTPVHTACDQFPHPHAHPPKMTVLNPKFTFISQL